MNIFLRAMFRGLKPRFSIGFFPALSVLISLFSGGCQEVRISQNEFQDLQAQMNPAPASQPAITPVSDLVVEQALGPFQIGPADILAVAINGTDQVGPTAPMQVRVNRQGQIELPIVGKVHVGGLEVEDAETAIQKAYVPRIYRQAVVHLEIVKPDIAHILVTGAVASPGLVPLLRNQRNLLHAVVAAGGITEQSSRQVVLRRVRAPRESLALDLGTPEGIRQALALAPLQAGDIVEVPAAVPNMIFVGGLVRDPRPQFYPPGVPMTVLQALAAAGGLRTDLTPREATLIRRLSDGQDVQVRLDLDRIARGQDPNLTLAAGDILWVPYTVETRVQEWINQNIYFKAGMSATYSEVGEHNYLHGERFNNAGAGGGGNLQDRFDPFGFLNRSTALQNLIARPAVNPQP